jgi:hypothetical protein
MLTTDTLALYENSDLYYEAGLALHLTNKK